MILVMPISFGLDLIHCWFSHPASYFCNALNEVLELGPGHLLTIIRRVYAEGCFKIEFVVVLAAHVVVTQLVEDVDGQLFALFLIKASLSMRGASTGEEVFNGLCDEVISPLFVAQMFEWIYLTCSVSSTPISLGLCLGVEGARQVCHVFCLPGKWRICELFKC